MHWTVLIQKEFRWIKTVGHREFSIEFSETEGRTGADEISNLHLFPFLPLFIFIHFCYNGEKCKDPEEVLDMEEKKMMEREAFTIYDDNTIGIVRIADEVVAIIAGLAATEVEGVASMAGNITNELVGKLGMKNLSKGVKVEVMEGVVSVDLTLNMKYGYNIPETCEQVQKRVKSAIENMTGLEASDVNISIAEVEIEKAGK